MKKKIGIILLAVLLCVVIVASLGACSLFKKDKTTSTEEEGKTTTTATVSQADQDKMFSKIDTFLDSWLLTNAQEEGEVTNQTKTLKADLKDQNASFSFTDSNKKKLTPTYNISFKNGVYTIEVVWSAEVKKTYTKEAKTVKYENWAGKYSKPSDEWLLDSVPSATVDTLVAAGVKTVNYVTGNAITGKFGADGVIGITVAGKSYGLRIKGNVDGTTKENNEIGIALVDEDLNELGGIYYKAAANKKDSKIYLQYSSTGEDGKLIREDGKIVYSYKYLDYADIYSLIKEFLPKDNLGNVSFPEANDGVLQFKDEYGPIEIDGLTSLFSAMDIDATVVNVVINMIAKSYEHEGRYYIDINLGQTLAQITNLTSQITLDLDFLNALHIDLANLSGLLGHITISSKVGEDGMLSDFELAVNIPKCTFYLNAEEDPLKIDIPAISFALYLEDFTFLKTGRIQNVIPADAKPTSEGGKAVYFSPTNIDMSGDVYILHTEGESEMLNDTFHYQVMTDINPFNLDVAKAALVIKQHEGRITYTDANKNDWSNFLSISYDQSAKLLCVSGTAFELEDGGNTVYKYNLFTNEGKFNLDEIKTWLGIDNWQDIFSIDDNSEFAKESAKAVFDNELAKALIKYFSDRAGLSAPEESAEASFDVANIGDYFSVFKDLYDKFVGEGKIAVSVEDGFSFKADVDDDMINEVIGAINDTFGVTLPTIEDPEYVKVFINYGEYEGGAYITVKYDGNVYELTVDGGFSFKMTLPSNRVYEFKYVHKTATFSFDIKNAQGQSENYTEVALSNFHFSWGDDNGTKIGDLMLVAGDDLIFDPSGDNCPATQLVKGVMSLLNSENVRPAALVVGKFIIRQFVD